MITIAKINWVNKDVEFPYAYLLTSPDQIDIYHFQLRKMADNIRIKPDVEHPNKILLNLTRDLIAVYGNINIVIDQAVGTIINKLNTAIKNDGYVIISSAGGMVPIDRVESIEWVAEMPEDIYITEFEENDDTNKQWFVTVDTDYAGTEAHHLVTAPTDLLAEAEAEQLAIANYESFAFAYEDDDNDEIDADGSNYNFTVELYNPLIHKDLLS
jgi:hypothetical protein